MNRVKKEYNFNYFYKITNNINGHYYYGIHSTNNINDGYMGSGKRLHYAYKKYGIENFTKEILKFFDSREEASIYESEMVTEQLVKNSDCYNCIVGGDNINTIGKIVTYDILEKKKVIVDVEKFHTFRDRYKSFTEGYVIAKLKNGGEFKPVSIEEFKNNRELYETTTEDKVNTKDKNGRYYCVSKNDPRYLSGELKHVWYGRKHKEEDIEKVKKTFSKIKHQQGEKNSQFGTCWITKDDKSIKIKKEDLEKYVSEGWKKGRSILLPNSKLYKIPLEKVIKMRESGMLWKEIADKFGICETMIYKYKKINNI